MSLPNPKSVVTEERLSDFYQAILPYIGGIEVDDVLSSSSTNPVQNRVITTSINGLPRKLNQLQDTNITSPSEGQILEYDGTNSVWKNAENIKDFARFGGSKTFSQLDSTLLTSANVDKFYLCTDGGTIASADASNWILPAGSVIPPDSHIAVIEYTTGVYKFDDFGGYIDISGKADKSELDGWTSTATVSNNTVTFTGLDNSYGYDLYCEDKLLGISSVTKTTVGSTITLQYVVTGAIGGETCKLRIIK